MKTEAEIPALKSQITEADLSDLAASLLPDLQEQQDHLSEINSEINELGKMLYEHGIKLSDENTPEDVLTDIFYREDEICTRLENVRRSFTSSEEKIDRALEKLGPVPHQEVTA